MSSPPDLHPADQTAPREADHGALAALSRFARTRPDVERCELCGAELAPEHPHLLNRGSRQIACSCDACAILFCAQQSANFLRVPRRVLKIEDFHFSDADWEALTLPIRLAFFVRGRDGATIALYPSPAGVMESLLDLPAWEEFTHGHAALATLEPEVEALLVNRIGERNDTFLVPLDAAYRLVGTIRTTWRGLSGGTAVWQAIQEFFASLDRRATPVGEVAHA